MRILYGVQGTGHGHLVRSAAMVGALRALGHRVHCLLSGRDESAFPEIGRFAPYTVLPGFHGVARGGRVRLVETVRRLRIPGFFADVRRFDAGGFDLVVTDYEPVAAWIARRHRLPSIGLGHLYAFRRPLPLIGVTRPLQAMVRHFTRLYTPVERALGLHWHPFGGLNLPPTIPADVCSADAVRQDKVVVYLPGESREEVVRTLRRVGHLRFVVYGAGESAAEDGNVWLRPHSRSRFVADLADAAGVITNAGFSLPSEALHLGRRLLVKPIRRHPEQLLNARALRTLGLGTVTDRLSAAAIAAWGETPLPPPMAYPDVVGRLVAWIDRGAWERPEELVEETWSDVPWRPS